jgi:cell division protein FtsN
MDVGFYLGELLMQQGEVSVPGLGYFVQARVSGYYDEEEGKVYPPYHQVQFDVQSIDDDALAQYIAVKKKISLASSQYFTEKYITALKQQAIIDEVAIGNIGWFYTDQAQLTFRPSSKLLDDSIFYGYRPIKLNKVNADVQSEPVPAIPHTEPIYPLIPDKPIPTPEIEPEAEYETNSSAPQESFNEEETENQVGYDEELLSLDEEEETRSPMRRILITLTVIVVVGVSLFALYTYAPDTFERLQFWKSHKAIVKPIPVEADTLEQVITDTVNTDTAKTTLKDSTAKAAIVADTVSASRFELIAASCKTDAEANKLINDFIKAGLNARIVTDAPGKRRKITVGTYKTRKEAEDAALKLIDAKKIKTDSYPQEIKKKKQQP